jgi:hypothetical protein
MHKCINAQMRALLTNFVEILISFFAASKLVYKQENRLTMTKICLATEIRLPTEILPPTEIRPQHKSVGHREICHHITLHWRWRIGKQTWTSQGTIFCVQQQGCANCVSEGPIVMIVVVLLVIASFLWWRRTIQRTQHIFILQSGTQFTFMGAICRGTRQTRVRVVVQANGQFVGDRPDGQETTRRGTRLKIEMNMVKHCIWKEYLFKFFEL